MNIIKSDIISLHGAAISMIGGRPENQDDMGYLDTPLGFLIIVCDGMGGGPGGKTASYIVKHEIAKTILECSPQTPRDHALKMAAARAHQVLEDEMKENPALSGMGSTFVAVLLNSQSAVIAHSGDSRCYRLHGKKCLFRTQDHSLVAELVRRKVMTEEDARLSPQSNIITRGLGSTKNHVPEIDEIPYKRGDRFVLCTDGVWGAMHHQELLKAFAQPRDIQQLLSGLSAQVDKIGFSKGGQHDNHTIAMFEVEKDSQLKESMSWKRWAMISLGAVFVVGLIVCGVWSIFCSKVNNGHFTSETMEYIPSYDTHSGGYERFDYSTTVEKSGTLDDANNVEQDSSSEENKRGNIESDKIISSDDHYRQLSDTLLNRLTQIGKSKDGLDTIKDKKETHKEIVNTKSIETIQKLINRYDSAKVIGEESLEQARNKIMEKRKEIKDLFDTLSDHTKNSEYHLSVERIKHVVDASHSWDIAKEPDSKSKLYVPTVKAKGLMNRQIERLNELKRNLEK